MARRSSWRLSSRPGSAMSASSSSNSENVSLTGWPSIVTSRWARSRAMGPTTSTSSPIARVPAPPQHGADPAAQLGQAKRLGHVVVGTGLQAEHRVGLGVQGREHDDGDDVAAAAQRAADLVPVRARAERDIEQNDVEAIGGGPVDRRAAVRDPQYPVALPGERPRQHLPQVGLVVDDQDAQRGIGAAGEPVGGRASGTGGLTAGVLKRHLWSYGSYRGSRAIPADLRRWPMPSDGLQLAPGRDVRLGVLDDHAPRRQAALGRPGP